MRSAAPGLLSEPASEASPGTRPRAAQLPLLLPAETRPCRLSNNHRQQISEKVEVPDFALWVSQSPRLSFKIRFVRSYLKVNNGAPSRRRPRRPGGVLTEGTAETTLPFRSHAQRPPGPVPTAGRDRRRPLPDGEGDRGSQPLGLPRVRALGEAPQQRPACAPANTRR